MISKFRNVTGNAVADCEYSLFKGFQFQGCKMSIPVFPFPVGRINNPAKIRVLVYANNQFAHIALAEITRPLEDRIAELEARIISTGAISAFAMTNPPHD